MPEVLLLLGQCLCKTGEFRASVDVLKKLLSSHRADTSQLLLGMFYLAESYEAAGNAKGALKIYKRVVGQDKSFADGEAQKRMLRLESELGID